ncbi:hypothetical protein [Paramaledivibacter caminithermalis]|uniref:BNR repeat-like domain-containing protein n=1 Tax=Paramaledivibacter caminithermalis (strain DSM 15212 / CIP 107654 / DViRD3) TaxID=1121301 RepID=A0A1M6JVJ2_PARC5|nr:hypothetical protein [Paramaledivibacter caminithermalis]SHJ50652.1 hypothetical protein SAMN02745912_00174 [Paramaledivibacter caminithermalis DSM 15212]
MAFINNIQRVIRKSNGNIVNFYVQDNSLYTREFVYNQGWNNPISMMENIKHNQVDIKIDNKDMLYGIANKTTGEMLYIFSNKNILNYNTLFRYDNNKYIIKYPYIEKRNNSIAIAYYFQELKNKKEWTIAFHFFDGIKWTHNHIYSIKAFPIINPFLLSIDNKCTNLFYFDSINGKEEIFIKRLSTTSKLWQSPIQLTFSNSQKLYLNILKEDSDIYHIAWSEFIDKNLVIRYVKGYFKDDKFIFSKVISLSEPSNCSFPTFVKTNKALWCIWVQMNKLFSSYSLDDGYTWSNPKVDKKSENCNFIRYHFSSNHHQDLENFKLSTIFGTRYPIMSFLGFKNIS